MVCAEISQLIPVAMDVKKNAACKCSGYSVGCALQATDKHGSKKVI
jgi:hypothetical protein